MDATDLINTSPNVATLSYIRDGAKARSIVRNWHQDVHDGPFWMCMEQPCHAVNAS